MLKPLQNEKKVDLNFNFKKLKLNIRFDCLIKGNAKFTFNLFMVLYLLKKYSFYYFY